MRSNSMYPLHARRKGLLNNVVLAALVLVLIEFQSVHCDIKLSTQDISIKLHESEAFYLETGTSTESDKLIFVVQHSDIVKINPPSFTLIPGVTRYNFTAEGTNAGHSEVTLNSTNGFKVENVYLRITVYKSAAIDTISIIIGWIYFVAWSVSFYPQIYINYKRKSVIGYNFDFLSLNIVGFTLYSIFNLGLYFVTEVKEEYVARYPESVSPVAINDVFFALHAVVACIITTIQCLIYERSDQSVSTTAKGILLIFGGFLVTTFILSSVNEIHWLDFLYYCSYIKLLTTLTKYVPQAFMNFKRKSTVGFSIGTILLDFAGGIFSLSQMLLSSFNYNDWMSIFGNPTKFGLGLFTLGFDILFMAQHYVLYTSNSYEFK